MGANDWKRREKNRRQNPRFLVVSEGKVTEPQYLEAIKKSRKIRSVDLVIVPPPPTSPRQIVEKARDSRRQAKKNDPYDAVWCVFDVEAKVTQQAGPNLDDAFQMARDNKIDIALSNPCFELWVLLHEEDCQACIYSDNVRRKCSELGLVDKKHIQNPDQLLQKYPGAAKRAKCLDAMHQRNGTTGPAQQNPSSGVYRLVEAIFEAFPPCS